MISTFGSLLIKKGLECKCSKPNSSKCGWGKLIGDVIHALPPALNTKAPNNCTRETLVLRPRNNNSKTLVCLRICSLRNLLKIHTPEPHYKDFDPWGLVWGLVICIFSKYPDGSDTDDPGPPFGSHCLEGYMGMNETVPRSYQLVRCFLKDYLKLRRFWAWLVSGWSSSGCAFGWSLAPGRG